MNDRTPQIDVIVENGIRPEEQEAIRDYLAGAGLAASLDTTDFDDFRPGVSSALTGFDPGVSGKSGKNGYRWGVLMHARINELVEDYGAENLRAAVEGLRQLRAKQTGSSPGKGLVMLIDEDTGIRVDLDFQLPLNAYQALEGMRFPSFEADPLSYHRKAGPNGRWRAPR